MFLGDFSIIIGLIYFHILVKIRSIYYIGYCKMCDCGASVRVMAHALHAGDHYLFPAPPLFLQGSPRMIL